MQTYYIDTASGAWYSAAGKKFGSNAPALPWGAQEKIRIILIKAAPEGYLAALTPPEEWPRDNSMAGTSAILGADKDFIHKLKLTLAEDAAGGAAEVTANFNGEAAEIPAGGVLVFADGSEVRYSARDAAGGAVTFVLDGAVTGAHSAGEAVTIPQEPYCAAEMIPEESDPAAGEFVFDLSLNTAKIREAMQYSGLASLPIRGLEILFIREPERIPVRSFLLNTFTITGTVNSWQAPAGTPGGGGNAGGSGAFYECVSVGEGVWSGCAWSLADGIYVKTEEVTDGLTWDAVKPVVGKSYSADALISAKLYAGGWRLPAGVPTDGLAAWYPFNGELSDVAGGNPDAVMTGRVDMSEGFATGWSTSNYLTIPEGVTGDSTEWTVGFVIQKSTRGSELDLQENRNGGDGVGFCDLGSWYHIQYQGSEWTAGGFDADAFSKFELLAVTNDPNGSANLYFGGVLHRSFAARSITIEKPWTVGAGYQYGSLSSTGSANRIKHVFFYRRALSAAEMAALYSALRDNGDLE